MRIRPRLGATCALALAVAAATTAFALVSTGTAGAKSAPKAAPAPTTASFDLQVSVESGGTAYSGSVSGQVNLAKAQVSATVTVPEGLGTVVSAVAPAMGAMLPSSVASDTTAQIVISGRTLYLQLPNLTIGSKSWLAVPLPAMASLMPVLGPLSKGLENVNRLGVLAKKLGLSVTSLGTGLVGGQEVDGYATTVGVATLLAHFPRVTSTMVGAVVSAVGPSIPLQVWAVPNGPVLQVSSDFAPPAGSEIQSIDVSLDFSNWGEALAIAKPPARDVLRLHLAI